jgi:hypothetical protein
LWHLDAGQAGPPILLAVAETAEQAVPAQALQGDADGFVLRPLLHPPPGNIGQALEQQTPAPLHRRQLERPVDAADLAAEQRRRAHLPGVQVAAAERRGQGDAPQGMTYPVGNLPVLLGDEGGDGRQVVAHVLRHAVVAVALVAWRQAVAAHLGDPHIEAGTRQVRAQADAPGRVPETPVGKAAVQQHHRHPARIFGAGQAETGQGQLDAGVRAVVGFDKVDVLAEIAAQFGADQGDGE